eukprot:TRINITY_DN5780_c0_g1_i2.p1 TRINITY_DN5780_c0_g1~~TRINITY_DN5780_c0_g1_i2.p1  ORF type:complete len:696 (+),score=124.75 TRINITY_DN5780_c0_g1_i2:840-2927(+)
MPYTVLSITSPTHQLLSDKQECSEKRWNGKFAPSRGDQNITPIHVHVELACPPHTPLAVGELVDDLATVMLSFSLPTSDACSELGEFDNNNEIVCLIDQSGSMVGSRMMKAKRALQLLLSSLPAGTFFNVVGFGTGQKLLFPQGSVSYDDNTVAQARDFVEQLDNMGGTNVLTPLVKVIGGPRREGRPRQVMLLTDGAVDNTAEVISFAKEHSEGTRIFTFGIGAGADKTLVRSLASVSSGTAVFITEEDSVEEPVIAQLRASLCSVKHGLSVSWAQHDPLTTVPSPLPSFAYAGHVLSVFATFPPSAFATEGIVCAAGCLKFNFSVAITTDAGSAVQKLSAARRIVDLQRSDENKAEVLRLALAHNLVSRHTSFVAVEIDGPAEAVTASMRTCVARLQVPHAPAAAAYQAVHRCHRAKHVACRDSNSSSSAVAGVRRGQYVIINGVACKVSDVAASKTGKHGSAKVHIVAVDPATGAKHTLLAPASSAIEQASVSEGKYLLVNASEEGLISVMADDGTTKDITVTPEQFKLAETLLNGTDDVEVATLILPGTEVVTRIGPSPAPAPAQEHQPPTAANEAVAQAPTAMHGGTPFDRLCFLQRAAGYWEPSDALAAAVGATSAAQLLVAAPAALSADETGRTWATLVALATLELRHAALRPQWCLLGDKAHRWLRSAAAAHLDACSVAGAFVKSLC